jgi:hypothetical protein
MTFDMNLFNDISLKFLNLSSFIKRNQYHINEIANKANIIVNEAEMKLEKLASLIGATYPTQW